MSRRWAISAIGEDLKASNCCVTVAQTFQKSCCAIRNIGLKDILKHSRLIAVTKTPNRLTDTTPAPLQPSVGIYGVEFYLYPTVSTALVHSVKPKLTE